AYGMFGTSRDPDPACGEGGPIFYRKDRWELDANDNGQLWLSDTPGVRASRLADATHSRIMAWGRFHEREGGRRTGRTILFSNTHLDYLFEHTILLQGAICNRLLAEQARPGEPVILTGDFNSYERSWPIRHMLGETLPTAPAIPTATLPLRDAWREAHPGEPDTRTFHRWGDTATENRRIDYVFFAGDLRVMEAQIVRTRRGDDFPSDHYPLSAAFEFA
ncbi:MAG: endonuclease/exonuclease/phosphatase family protein, partial [Kiritimatiellae bacterium]|nr:endonuclease/exonuclease/phosphatase family protein [Kiritimatiellia bacterium]